MPFLSFSYHQTYKKFFGRDCIEGAIFRKSLQKGFLKNTLNIKILQGGLRGLNCFLWADFIII